MQRKNVLNIIIMRKVIYGLTAILIIGGVASLFFYSQSNALRLAPEILDNIEALTDEEVPSGTCGVAVWSGDSWMICVCNTSYEYAQSIYNDPEFAHLKGTPYLRWCCDSCGSTPYCGSGS